MPSKLVFFLFHLEDPLVKVIWGVHSILEMETGKVGWTPLTERRNEGPKGEILTLF